MSFILSYVGVRPEDNTVLTFFFIRTQLSLIMTKVLLQQARLSAVGRGVRAEAEANLFYDSPETFVSLIKS